MTTPATFPTQSRQETEESLASERSRDSLMSVQTHVSSAGSTVASLDEYLSDKHFAVKIASFKAPADISKCFDHRHVEPWHADAWEPISKLQDAPRNRGQVMLMRNKEVGKVFAVKQMPNNWVCKSHAKFSAKHPDEDEMPWKDFGCMRFLESMHFPYLCPLHGLYRDAKSTFSVMELATEGDLFKFCIGGPPVGKERESLVRPIFVQMLSSVKLLHEYSIVHGDLSLENILLTKLPNDDGNGLHVRLCDFSTVSTSRIITSGRKVGKKSYQAPEMSKGEVYDGFCADMFSLGVSLFALLLQDYPWNSTIDGQCRCFDYFKAKGLRAYAEKKRVRDTQQYVADFLSEDLLQLLEGLLAIDPSARLTLYDQAKIAKSVWAEPWILGHSSSLSELTPCVGFPP
eukprot:gnl/TRDRNA2_/TRDRNA2_146619_c0_seq4.p1 gnl/TRDRNA2_/TRDRNA2_146619_c0~~gnl/TRDRNA2_/TRDRNA2_146619_c0_seq4.p1  ORF type:complete len:401 (-),score=68.46 gnl/TRDRNA2_/TRDRNA2_146619_c0_seq4:60-1262(-)